MALSTTLNGVDGFLSGKWDFHANARVISDEALEMTPTSIGEMSTLIIDAEPNETYVVRFESNKHNVVYLHTRNEKGANKAMKNGSHFANGESFVTPSDAVQIRILIGNYTNLDPVTMENLQINRGTTPIPFSKKTGTRMVMPKRGKNLFDLNALKRIEGSPRSITFNLKPNTAYTFSSDVPGSQHGDPLLNRHMYVGTTGSGDAIFSGQDITRTTDANGRFVFHLYLGRQYSQDLLDGKYYIQLEEGTQATPFEPFTYQLNAPAPSPRAEAARGLRFDGMKSTLLKQPRLPHDDSYVRIETEFTWLGMGADTFSSSYGGIIHLGSYAYYLCIRSAGYMSFGINSLNNIASQVRFHNPVIGKKYHVVVEYDRTLPVDNLKMHVDGALVNTATFNEPIILPTYSNIHIGSWDDMYHKFNGIISKVNVRNRFGEIDLDLTGANAIMGDIFMPNAENLLPSLDSGEWLLHPNLVLTGPNSSYLPSSSYSQISRVNIPVDAGKKYIVGYERFDNNWKLTYFDKDDKLIGFHGSTNGNNTPASPPKGAIRMAVEFGVFVPKSGVAEFNGFRVHEIPTNAATIVGTPEPQLKPAKRTLYAKR